MPSEIEILKYSKIRKFAYEVFRYLFENSWETIIEKSVVTKVRGEELQGFYNVAYGPFKQLLYMYPIGRDERLDIIPVPSKTRFYTDPVYRNDESAYFFTTEWNAGGRRNYSLSFDNLKTFIEERFPEFKVLSQDGVFSLVSNKNQENTPRIKRSKLCFNRIFYGPPGTGKTFKLRDELLHKYDGEKKRYVFTTFHQAFSYEDFVEGIKPVMGDTKGEVQYEVKPGVFKEICELAKNDSQNQYAIFIDEINRGNVASIFGELITLIEPDKRLGASNEMNVTLPYSKEEFGVPGNLDIIGTMNTADRSVEALDTALRRRFSFQEVLPKPGMIKEILGDKSNYNGIQLGDVLERINYRIEKLIDRDHTIGHAYFLKLKDSKDFSSALVHVFCDNIMPLLQEYFYNDYPKIGLVLGKGFVKVFDNDSNQVKFADFDAEGADDYMERELYRLVSKKELSKDDNLSRALETLMGVKSYD